MLNSTIIKFNYGRYVKEARIQSLDLCGFATPSILVLNILIIYKLF
jgi:hypothetical protein